MNRFAIALAATVSIIAASAAPARAQTPTTLLNVSYDIARELYAEINTAFIK
ncbi:MAG: sulfate ABC transporter substrate-binding protein, partial [Tardiphaga sp.]|nr:sulfate ABC transporter substrate-binding protein [Tardiphaga sp.]